jgi:hypothetical protein
MSRGLEAGDYISFTHRNKRHYGEVKEFAGFLVVHVARSDENPFLAGRMIRLHAIERWIKMTEQQYFLELLRRG